MTTLQELNDQLVRWYMNEEELSETEINSYHIIYETIQEMPNEVEIPLGIVRVEENFGGEGMGDKRYIVVSLEAEDGSKEYFQYNGYYDSWNGTSWDDLEDKKVLPKEKVIITWVEYSD